ncbi:MAG: pantoate--beta-alanine ligase [Candidatus Kapaibacterium sp.]|nr:MAG: pantoate--beta-alanine ligase [Candidatus Kapabacteria bacterium]
MHIISSAAEMQRIALDCKRSSKLIGVVPTMGYLHAGHASLIRAAHEECDIVITTIFVNPLQFAPTEDLSRYPRDLARDTAIASEAGTDMLFTPTVEEMYTPDFAVNISIGGVTAPFEGEFRPTHFDGVATVVAKLFLLTQPDIAFFGQKDYQQCMVVQKMVRDLAFPLEVRICPTLREHDGLAMSSRNVYLSAEDRINALVLHKALQEAQRLVESGERTRSRIEDLMKSIVVSMSIPHLRVDYIVAADAQTLEQPDVFAETQEIVLLLALRLGSTRLIDNMVVRAV